MVGTGQGVHGIGNWEYKVDTCTWWAHGGYMMGT